MDYESELIALEEDFWLNNVQAEVPPPYFEDDGDLILESLRRLMGPSSKDAPPVLLTPPQSTKMFRFLELQAEKKQLDAEANRIKAEMDRIGYMKALWESFPEDGKPEWLTMEQILGYEERMLALLAAKSGGEHG